MSTAAKTSKSSAESDKRRKRKVDSVAKPMLQGCAKKLKDQAKSIQFRDIPSDVLDKILTYMAISHSPLSVIKLSMVNRSFRQGVNENLHVWYQLYLHWRGPVQPSERTMKTARGRVCLRPTVPTSLPNFQIKEPPQT